MRCKVCFPNHYKFAPKLRQSGYAYPFDYICPACDTLHSKLGEPKTREELEARQRQKESIKAYQKKWFS